MTLDDFTCSRIDHTTAIAPPARAAMYPLDYVVANIQWVCVWRKQLDLKSIFESRSFESLIPPTGTFD